MTKVLNVLRLLAAVVVLSALTVPAALAHAQMLATDPADGAVLAAAPERVSIRFNEPVTALAITLVGPDGTRQDLTEAASNGETLAVPLPADLPEGTQVLSWRIVSLDGHPVAGALVFSIGVATGGAEALPASDPLVSIGLWASKALTYAALFFGVGGAVFALFAPLATAARRLAMTLCAAGLVLAPLSLGFQGLDALGLPPDAAVTPTPWLTGWRTSFGPTVLVLDLAFLAGIIALCWPRLLWCGGLAWALAALGPVLSGHASAADPQWLTRPAVALHMAALLFWLGALSPLLFALRSNDAAAALSRFSRVIPLSILALLVSGITLAVIQLGVPGPAWLMPYGYLLGSKLVLVALLFALAAWNRVGLTRPALAGGTTAQRHLRLSIGVEIVIVLIVLGLVSGWRFTPPPRALALAPAPIVAPLYLHAMTADAMANIAIDPGQAGPVSLIIDITDASGAPASPEALAVTFTAPEMGIEAIKRDAQAEAGLWRIDDLTLPVAGAWHLILDIRMDRFSLVRLETDLDLP